MGKLTRGDKVAEWTARLARFESTRHSVASFCKRERVSTASLYLWRRKLAKGQRPEIRRVEPSTNSPFQRVEVATQPTASPRQAVIRLPAGITIELGSDPQVAAGIVESLVRGLCRPGDRSEVREC